MIYIHKNRVESQNALIKKLVARSYRNRNAFLSATIIKVIMLLVWLIMILMISVSNNCAFVEAFLFSSIMRLTSTKDQQLKFGQFQKRNQQSQLVLLPSFLTMPSSLKSRLYWISSGISISNNDTTTVNAEMITRNATIFASSLEHRLSTLLLTIKNQRIQRINHETKLIRDSQPSSALLNRLPSSCWAFIKILQQREEATTSTHTNTNANRTHVLIQQIAIQALRYAGEVNDYRFIVTLVDTLLQHYIDHPTQKRLDTRIFGEAIRSLSQTTTGPSKLRQMWKQMWRASYGLEQVTTRPPNAFELNTMIAALGEKGKIIAAIDLYHTYTDQNISNQTTQSDTDKHHHYIPPDSYTYSTLFDLLSISVVSNTSTFISNSSNMSTTHATSVFHNPSSIYPSYISTPFWQWKKVLQLLDCAATNNKSYHHNASSSLLNNFVYSAALKVNEKAVHIATQSHFYHDGATAAVDVLNHMETVGNVRPDIVTCTKVLSALEQGKRWRDAISLLDTMKKNTTLPLPNAFSYTCVISACSQCGKTKHALQLLDEVRDTHINNINLCNNTIPSSSSINTWVYNSALAAYNHKKRRRKQSLMRKQIDIVESFIDQMESDAKNFGFPCQPDTTTYNTALSCLSGIVLKTSSHGSTMQINKTNDDNQYLLTALQKLLSRMDENNISRDDITYKTAILCCQSSASSEELLHYALTLWEEASLDLSTSRQSSTSNKTKDTADSVPSMTKIANAVLEVCAQSTAPTSISAALLIMNQMIEREIPLESSSCLSTLLHSIGRNPTQYKMFPLWIEVLHGDDTTMASSTTLLRYYNLSSKLISSLRQCCPLQEHHYASMLTWCIYHNDLKRCMKILRKMKLNGVQPSVYTYETMISAFSKSSIALSSRLNTKKPWNDNTFHHKLIRDSAMSSAKAAKKILSKIHTPSFNILLGVCQACASSGLWSESVAVLKQVHRTFLSINRDANRNSYNINRVLIKLHRSLFSICARHGNAKDAVVIVNLIQELESSVISLESLPFSFLSTEDYKLVIIAAYKEKNWQICLQILQTLRPHIEAIRSNFSDSTRISQNDRDNLEFAFTSAVLCLEANGHYAWSIRVIHDWIEWSRAKPKKGALIATCRLIANADRGDQVLDLLSHVRRSCADADEEQSINDKNYFRDVYAQAIGSLHKNGDFACADELYCTAVEEGILPWAVVEPATPKHTNVDAENCVSPLTLDLHGMSASVAKSAVRVALQRELFRMPSWLNSSATEDDTKSEQREIIIVTGRGAHSTDRFQPILRPQVQQMLTEEFYPPLSSSSLKGNMGALLIPAEDVNAWLLYHKQQRGVQMLALANIIRNISFGTRLVRSLRRLAT